MGSELSKAFRALDGDPGVRAIVLTTREEVLLVRFEFPAGTRWALPGGGIEPGETPEDALNRELVEELGLRDIAIGPHVWNRLHIIPFLKGDWDGQREQFYVVEIDAAFDPQPMLTWEELNAEHVFEVRWWRIEEIAAATDLVFVPSSLASRLRELVDHGAPNPPVDVEI